MRIILPLPQIVTQLPNNATGKEISKSSKEEEVTYFSTCLCEQGEKITKRDGYKIVLHPLHFHSLLLPIHVLLIHHLDDEGFDFTCMQKQKGRGKRKSYVSWKRFHQYQKFKEGGKSITFVTYDGTFGATNKVLAFIQQYDAIFGDEDFFGFLKALE